MKKYNILMAHNLYKIPGGEDTVFKNECDLLEKNGHNVYKYIKDNKDIDKLNIFKKILLPFTTIFSYKTYKEIKKIIKKNNIDIIHVHNTLNLISPSVYYAAKKMKKPIVQTVHNFRLLCPNGIFYRDENICEDCPNKGLGCAIKNKCYRGSKLQSLINVLMLKFHRITGIYKYVNFIFLTEFNKNKFIQYNKKLKCFDENKFYIKPNFMNKKVEKQNSKKIKNQFIYVGRLDENKGIREVIKLWHKINNKKLVVCGTGPLEEELKKYSKTNNLNVEFKGFLKIEEVLKNIEQSEALIFSSKLYEGFPMTLLEAFSVNTPVICNNIGNAASIVTSDLGIIYNNEEELLSALEGIKKHKKVTISKDFLAEGNYETLLKIYNLIVMKNK